MKKQPHKDELLIVIIGRAGMGKSSLFNSLVGRKVVTEGHSVDPVTNSVTDTVLTINGIRIRLVDTPGFGALNGPNTDTIMKKIAEKLPLKGEEVNLVIYCWSMSPDSRLSNTDGEIAHQLTKTYQDKLWKNTLFALTFANVGKKTEGNKHPATIFNTRVAEYTDRVHTKLLIDERAGNIPQKVAEDIPILPVGYFEQMEGKSQNECCILPDGSNWLSNFWYQSLLRIHNPQARYAFFRTTCNIHPYLRENEHCGLTQE